MGIDIKALRNRSSAAILFPLLLIVLALMGAGGCGDGNDGDSGTGFGSIALWVVWDTRPQWPDDSIIKGVAGAGVESIAATVTADDIATPIASITDTTPGLAGTGTVDGVPVGDNRTLTLAGYSEDDAGGTQLYIGSQTGISVSAAITTVLSEPIVLAPVEGSTAISTITATAGDGEVNVDWIDVAGVEFYNLYHSVNPGVTNLSGTKVGGITSATFNHTNLTNGTTYYYVVTPVDANGEGNPSAEVAAIPMTVATVSAAAGDQRILLTWDAVAGADNYNVYWAEASGLTVATGTLVPDIAGLTYTHTGLTNDTTYYYLVTPESSIAEGGASDEVNATPLALTGAVSNVLDNGKVHSGFLIGTASTSASLVEISLDGGAFADATGAASWSFALPTGGATWRDGSQHTIAMRATDVAGATLTTATITVRKGNNQDVNGDGYADLAVGEDTFQSKMYVFHSSGTTGILGGGASFDADSSGNTIITSEDSGTSFGRFHAMGDVNGDGFADLAVGAMCYPGPSCGGNGRVYVYHSSGTTGILGGGTTFNAFSSAATVITGEGGNDFFGIVALGDVTGDGFADLVVGAYRYSGGANTGRVYVFHSSGATGILGGNTAATAAANANTTIFGEAAGSSFGKRLALADVTGDGRADLAVSAPTFSASLGRVYVFHANADGNGIGAASSFTAGTGTASTLIDGASGTTGFGTGFGAIAMGDVTGDGLADLAVGRNTTTSAGAAYVFHAFSTGGILGGGTSFDATNANTTIAGTGAADRIFGLVIGDFTGDGFGDLVFGDGSFSSSLGQAYVFHSTGSGGILGGGQSFTLAANHATHIIGGATAETLASTFSRSADYNGDGYSDLVLPAIQYLTVAQSQAKGRTYVFHSEGAAGILGGGSNFTANSTTADTIITGSSTNRRFGW